VQRTETFSRFWLSWTIATAISSLVGILAVLLWMVEDGVGPQSRFVVGLLAGMIFGGLMGSAQTVSLRNAPLDVRMWIIANTAGGAVGLGLGLWVADLLPQTPLFEVGRPVEPTQVGSVLPLWAMVQAGIIGIFVGGVMGSLQWLVLRSKKGTPQWIIINVVAWSIGLTLAAWVSESMGVFVALLINGLTVGLLTGWSLANWMGQQQ
jgi:hypothetical protein